MSKVVNPDTTVPKHNGIDVSPTQSYDQFSVNRCFFSIQEETVYTSTIINVFREPKTVSIKRPFSSNEHRYAARRDRTSMSQHSVT